MTETDSARRYWAVIPAAGGGSRMGGQGPKQYLPLAGRALIEHSLARFVDANWIEGVVVALASGDRQFAALPLAGHAKVRATTGGARRADSVLAGLRLVRQLCGGSPERCHVLVHDAARPCLTSADLERLRDAADDAHGALLALPAADTIKRGDDSERVVETLDRRRLWRAQTPQLFRLDLLAAALEAAMGSSTEITDEASAMEAAGHRPRLVRGSERNIKVTYPEDLAQAGFWLSRIGSGP